jgi:hypothetical protein
LALVSYSLPVNARAPLKVLGRLGSRGKGATDASRSGEADTANGRKPDHVDEQISSLLQSLEVDLTETGLSQRAGRVPNLSTPTSSHPIVDGQPKKSTFDRRAPTPARTLRRAVLKGRGLSRPRGHWVIPRRLRRGTAALELVRWIITAVLVGIGGGLAISLLLE